jgi:uncharacterized protein YkwD
MKNIRVVIIAAIFLLTYFFREPIIEKIKPLILNIPLTPEAKKLIGLNEVSNNTTKKEIPKNKEVSLPGPLAQLINQNENAHTNFNYTEIIRTTNAERAKYNLKPLTEKNILNSSAIFKANDLNTLKYFEHKSPSGKDIGNLASQFGYEYVTIGENLAMGNFESEDAIVEAWMNSPGHRANILNPKYTQIGVGLILGTWQGQPVWFAVQHFGKPLSDCPNIDKSLKSLVEKNQTAISKMQSSLNEQRIIIENGGDKDPDYENIVKGYNELVARYNALVNETKSKINTYNLQVKAFNKCTQ